mmetsp:Transcript_27338/g.32057  ORF Transcript_27338/g.32057 Transcript_27338/m.32057 type:complete len:148 (-) Transcript_27338:55-498(-)
MPKFIRTGKVVVILQGRFAGRKAVVLRTHEGGHGDRKFAYAIVAGVDRPPRRVAKGMSKTKIEKRLSIKPFVKAINFNHMMPTRYNLDIADKLKALVSDDTLSTDEKKAAARKKVKVMLDDRYKTLAKAKNEKAMMGASYFFQKLHF